MSAPDPSPLIDADFRPRRADHAAFVEVDGETVVYDEVTGQLHLLDQIATVVWACFDGTASIATLADELSQAFGADREVVERDVRALAERLAGEDLVADARATADG
jgi:hypothetical protein